MQEHISTWDFEPDTMYYLDYSSQPQVYISLYCFPGIMIKNPVLHVQQLINAAIAADVSLPHTNNKLASHSLHCNYKMRLYL